MADKLTPQQAQAVCDRGGKLLVSAAAGSGKTKVLVDRLLKYLTDQDDPAIMESERKELFDWNHFAAGLDGRYFKLKEGQTYELGSMKVEILSDKNLELKSNFCNNQSCAIRVTEDDFTMLFFTIASWRFHIS